MTISAQAVPAPLPPIARTLLSVIRATPLKRGGFRRFFLRQIKKRVHHPIVTDFRGVPFIFTLDNTTETKALFGHYNLEELAFLKKHTVHKANPVFVDLGANCGFYTQNFLALGKGTVLAIEPNPKMYSRIEANHQLLCDRTMKSGALIVERSAIGDKTGEMSLDLNHGYGSARLVESGQGKTIKVAVRLFEDVLQSHGIPSIDVLKADIEGYEDRALAPFFNSAPRSLFPRHIIIEHSSGDKWQTDLFAIMRDKGYREIFRTRGNMMLSLTDQ